MVDNNENYNLIWECKGLYNQIFIEWMKTCNSQHCLFIALRKLTQNILRRYEFKLNWTFVNRIW